MDDAAEQESTAPHAFDLFDDSADARELIRHILAFLQFELRETRV